MTNTPNALVRLALPALVLVVLLAFIAIRQGVGPRSSQAGPITPGVEQVHLRGIVRDFRADHPDFQITGSDGSGHYAMNVYEELGDNGLPVFSGQAREVLAQWYDKDSNPISPYGDPGLFGGHFDVDVYEGPSQSKEYHEHEFDDKHDVTYIDIANDPSLLFEDIVGSDYANPLRIETINDHNGGGGGYIFEHGATRITGATADGISGTFMAGDLTKLRVNFLTLHAMRGTSPGDSQGDKVDRDDAFAIRMYDTATDDLVYEFGVYSHVKGDWDPSDWEPESPPAMSGTDACGVDFDDTTGVYGAPGAGRVAAASTFNQWFQNAPGYNADKFHDIVLTKGPDGVYEFISNEFYPADNDLYGNEGSAHNNNFTYSIDTSFRYQSCQGQFIEIETNDDAWVFINGKRVIDIGGVGTPSRQYVALDRLGLVDGEAFDVQIFTAYRRQAAQSLFALRTNVGFISRMVSLPSGVEFD